MGHADIYYPMHGFESKPSFIAFSDQSVISTVIRSPLDK